MSAFTDWRDGVVSTVKDTIFGKPPTANAPQMVEHKADFLTTYKMPLLIVGTLLVLYFVIKKG